jgi:hypothetical protein
MIRDAEAAAEKTIIDTALKGLRTRRAVDRRREW